MTNETQRTGDRSVLVTGPSRGRDAWLEAARAAGWTAHDWPLIDVRPISASERLWAIDAALETLPNWLCITSSSTLSALIPLFEARAALRDLPLAIVGERSAERARALGLEPALPPAKNAHALADALIAHLGNDIANARVLWPRGSRSDVLGRRLRGAGATVEDPIVYRSEARAELANTACRPPLTDAILFASPSAVHAWRDHCVPRTSSDSDAAAEAPAPLAIAIGPTTLAALRENAALFTRPTSLSSSKPEALRAFLESQSPSTDCTKS